MANATRGWHWQAATSVTYQLLDPVGRIVEAPGDERDLVLPADLDPRGKSAFAPMLDPATQIFKPAGQIAHGRQRGDADGDRHDEDRQEKLALLLVELAIHENEHLPAIRQFRLELTLVTMTVVGEIGIRGGLGGKRAGALDVIFVPVENRDIGMQAARQTVEHVLALFPSHLGTDERAGKAVELAGEAVILIVGEHCERAERKHDQQQAAKHRQIHLDIETAADHWLESSWLRAKM